MWVLPVLFAFVFFHWTVSLKASNVVDVKSVEGEKKFHWAHHLLFLIAFRWVELTDSIYASVDICLNWKKRNEMSKIANVMHTIKYDDIFTRAIRFNL